MSSITEIPPAENTPSTPENPPAVPQSAISFPFFPSGQFTLILGDPGVGKSTLARDLVARITQRSPLPPHTFTPSTVPNELYPHRQLPCAIVCVREGNRRDTKYALAAAGANLHELHILDGTSLVKVKPPAWIDTEYDRLLAKHPPLLAALYDICQKDNPRVIILDPLPAFLENLDCSNPYAVRRTLEPIINFADRSAVYLIGISHLNKTARSKNLLYRSLGSNLYTALARSVLLLTTTPPPAIENRKSKLENPFPRRYLVPLKNSTDPITHALSFTIRGAYIAPHDVQPGDKLYPVIDWNPDPIPLDLHTDPTRDSLDPLERSRLQLALDFLNTNLAHGPVPSAQLQKEARSIGITQKTLDRARLELGAITRKPHSHFITYLPHHPEPLDDYTI